MTLVSPVNGQGAHSAVANGFTKLHLNGHYESNIIDIRQDREKISLRDEIEKGLNPEKDAEKRLPTLLLYNERGLQIFEEITYLDEYYLTNDEIEVLKSNATNIAQSVRPGSMIIELGSGNLRKVNILLEAIEKVGVKCEYYALDLSLDELRRTLTAVPSGTFKHIECFGLWGTYDDGLDWMQKPKIAKRPKAILSLGSSIGNFPRVDAAQFLKGFVDVLQQDDVFIIGIDACKDPSTVFHAYNDRHGITHRFVANGLVHANDILGEKVFDLEDWTVIGEYNAAGGRHQAFVVPSKDVKIGSALIKADEKVRIEESYKYSSSESEQLFDRAGAKRSAQYTNKRGNYSIHTLSRNQHAFSSDPIVYASDPVPTISEWQHLWNLWDTVTRQMIPDEELLGKPIKLRNACIFYLGHIPTFLDMKIAESTDGSLTEPTHYPKIFERGIDPDVDNPEHCHAHSEIPEEWPPVEEILVHQRRVRERVHAFYASGAVTKPNVARCMWLGYEHEAMHLETLLYMLIQSDKTLPPQNTPQPIFDILAQQARQQAVPNKWTTIPEQDVTLNMNDPETESGPTRYFGWDVEKPARTTHVSTFAACNRPISNGEYVMYLRKTGGTTLPASWRQVVDHGHSNNHANGIGSTHTNGLANGNGSIENSNGVDHELKAFLQGKTVQTVYGSVPLEYALEWPVSASYDELSACAQWMGGRIPTLEEAHSIYKYVESGKAAEADQALGKMIPAVNSHLVNDGVQESPPDNSASKVERVLDPHDLFADLKGCNVGFQHWHLLPVTHKGSKLCGRGDMGGLWEWTSTSLYEHDGFEPMPLYPAYSKDFFDNKHNIVLGGSWATVPRIAGRKSFLNWYQRNYPYAWAGARIVKNL